MLTDAYLMFYCGWSPERKTGLYRVRPREHERTNEHDAFVIVSITASKPAMSFTMTWRSLAFCRTCGNHDCAHAMFVQSRARTRS